MKKLLELLRGQKISSEPLPELPDEIWSLIFSYLPIKHLGLLARTTKRFKYISEENLIWLPIVERFLCTYPPQGNAKQYFVKYLPLLDLITKNKSKILKPIFHTNHFTIKADDFLKLDVLFNHFLNIFLIEKNDEDIYVILPHVNDNLPALKILINFFGFDHIKQRSNSSLRRGFEFMMEAAYYRENMEMMAFLFKLGADIFFSGKSLIIESIPVSSYLADAAIKGKSTMVDFLLSNCDASHIKKAISGLICSLGPRRDFDFSRRQIKVIDANNNVINNISNAIIQILASGKLPIDKVNQDLIQIATELQMNLGIIIKMDMDRVISFLLKKIDFPIVISSISSILPDVMQANAIKIFRLLTKVANLNEVITTSLFHLYIKSISDGNKKLNQCDRSYDWVRDQDMLYVEKNFSFHFDSSNKSLINMPTNCEEFVDVLTESGADINSTNEEGKTVLENAVQTGCSTLVAALLKNGAHITDKAREYSQSFSLIKPILNLYQSLEKRFQNHQENSAKKSNDEKTEASDLTISGFFKTNSNKNTTELPAQNMTIKTKEELRDYYVTKFGSKS